MITREQLEGIARQGAEAFERGMHRDICPYSWTHPAFAIWTRGYQNAAFGAAQLGKKDHER